MKPVICINKALNHDGERHYGRESKDCTEEFLTHYNLKENIEEYVQFMKMNTIYDLFMTMNVMINPSDNHIISVEDLYYTSDYVYQAIFKTVVKDTSYSYNSLVEDSNKLATQMLGERHVVDGNMIIIKRSIINKDFHYTDVTVDDITDIIRNQIIHSAVVLEENNINEKHYIYNPLEIDFSQSHIDNVRYHEFKFLDFRLFFHVDTKAPHTKLNKMASGIYGQNIYGNTLISLADNSDSSPLNLNLTSELINQMYTIIMYHRLNKSEIDRKKYGRNVEIKNKDIEDYDPKKHTTFEHSGFPEITLCPNFFQIIKLEYNEIKEKYTDYDVSFENTLNDIL
jgi:hypothetical protein